MRLQGKIINDKVQFSESFRVWAAGKNGHRFEIVPYVPESSKQRRFLHGCVVPLVTFFQEGYDYTSSKDNEKVFEWLKMEFCPELVRIQNIIRKVPGSTRGKLNQGFIEKIIDWLEENYGIDRTKVCNPQEYVRWVDETYSYGGPNTWIDYCLEMGWLTKN